MNVSINNKLLQEKLIKASKFTLSKISSVPSLQGGMLKASKGKLEIITTNLNDFFYTSIPIQTQEEFSIVIDIKKVVEFLSFLSAGDVEISVEKNNIVIKKEKTLGTFSLIPAEDFPKLPILKGKTYELSKKFLEKNLPLVLFSVSKDESRPTLTGVNFLTKEDVQYIVSTDGFRLSLIRDTAKNELPPVIISAPILHEVIGLSIDTSMTVSEEEKIVCFKMGEDSIYTRLIEGEFPPFERVIPEGYKTKITVETDEFARNIKLASVFARDYSSIIVFDIKKDGLYIRPKLKDDKGTIVYQEAEIEGEEQKISFNYKFVLDFLNNAKSSKVSFEMKGSNDPGVFKTDDNKNYTHIIMPIRTD